MKKKTLQEHSENYRTHIKPYEEFKKAEDHKRIVLSFLRDIVRNKIVLDLGCGEGTEAKILAPLSKHYYALDISSELLKRAKQQCRNIKNIDFLHSTGEKIDLSEGSIDVVICSWVISVVNGYRRKTKVLAEAERVLKPAGEIILTENDWLGEFERIRLHPKRTKYYNEWLIKKGFEVSRNVHTYFEFPSCEIAKQTFEHIWGKRISSKIKSKIIKHQILIFRKQKRVNP